MPQKPSLARRAQCFGKPRTGRGKLSPTRQRGIDRKSTRLNSSHSQISYAAFCLKKKEVELSQPDNVASRAFQKEIYGRNLYGRNTSVAAYKAITRNDIVSFAGRRILPGAALLVF